MIFFKVVSGERFVFPERHRSMHRSGSSGRLRSDLVESLEAVVRISSVAEDCDWILDDVSEERRAEILRISGGVSPFGQDSLGAEAYFRLFEYCDCLVLPWGALVYEPSDPEAMTKSKEFVCGEFSGIGPVSPGGSGVKFSDSRSVLAGGASGVVGHAEGGMAYKAIRNLDAFGLKHVIGEILIGKGAEELGIVGGVHCVYQVPRKDDSKVDVVLEMTKSEGDCFDFGVYDYVTERLSDLRASDIGNARERLNDVLGVILSDILDALEALQSVEGLSVVNCDMKLENWLLRRDVDGSFSVVLCDWGVSMVLDSESELDESGIGLLGSLGKFPFEMAAVSLREMLDLQDGDSDAYYTVLFNLYNNHSDSALIRLIELEQTEVYFSKVEVSSDVAGAGMEFLNFFRLVSHSLITDDISSEGLCSLIFRELLQDGHDSKGLYKRIRRDLDKLDGICTTLMARHAFCLEFDKEGDVSWECLVSGMVRSPDKGRLSLAQIREGIEALLGSENAPGGKVSEACRKRFSEHFDRWYEDWTDQNQLETQLRSILESS